MLWALEQAREILAEGLVAAIAAGPGLLITAPRRPELVVTSAWPSSQPSDKRWTPRNGLR
jgi:hypothetical protein